MSLGHFGLSTTFFFFLQRTFIYCFHYLCDLYISMTSSGNVNSSVAARSDEDEDVPLSQLGQEKKEDKSNKNITKRKAASSNGTRKKNKNTAEVKKEDDNGRLDGNNGADVNEDEEAPLATLGKTKKKTTRQKGSKAARENKTESSEKDDVDGVKKEEDKDEEDEDKDYRKWWQGDEDLDGEQKWESLEHNGVIFPPEYEPLPSHVKLYYDNKPLNLPLPAEEVAGFYGAMLETDHAKNPTFQKNFFEDFLQVLKESGGCGVEITDFEKLDFTKMFAHFETLKEQKKLLSKDEKKRIREEREKFEEPYKTCLLNGRKEQVGNFKVEPPGLFRGRGAHPKTGKLKKRVYPEDITLNLSADVKVPEAPPGHKWAEVRHDNTVTWLAMWKDNIFDSFKYVRFAANSSVKGLSDYKKFETARQLKHHIEAIRKDYNKMLKDELMQNRQMATATYLIDIFALRAGGEKGEDEADTVGCCSLRYEHVTLKPPNTVIFDFLGKDSIRFYQEVEVDKQVFKNLRIFKKPPKQPGDNIFDRISPAMLNKQFQGYMKGLTAKVFRTYNASKTMQDQIDIMKNEGTVAEKVVKFNAANRTVAILCNHQRSVSKTHGSSVQKMNERLKEFIWQRIRLKKMLLEIEPDLKDKDPSYFSELDDLSKEEVMNIHHRVVERQRESVHRRFQRENEKLRAEGKPELTEENLKERLAKVDELAKEYEEELATGKPTMKKAPSVDKLKGQIEALDNRIVNFSFQLKDKEDNSEVSLGTSKLNYIDPRLTAMFSAKFGVPMEKLFTKTLREKFKWAIESVDANWRF